MAKKTSPPPVVYPPIYTPPHIPGIIGTAITSIAHLRCAEYIIDVDSSIIAAIAGMHSASGFPAGYWESSTGPWGTNKRCVYYFELIDTDNVAKLNAEIAKNYTVAVAAAVQAAVSQTEKAINATTEAAIKAHITATGLSATVTKTDVTKAIGAKVVAMPGLATKEPRVFSKYVEEYSVSSTKILYVGKYHSGCIRQRIKEHFGFGNFQTGALQLHYWLTTEKLKLHILVFGNTTESAVINTIEKLLIVELKPLIGKD